ncbi:MAG TPA: protein-glutamate O-methyltransferase [Acidobacteriaceae bacterium]|jgi:chemotaxis protein methyltransferase CheR|nr:protein-glutamate O-methyltransferase [Acidobacteriaceae bacterium]
MSIHEETLSGRDFNRLSAFIYQEAGIRLGVEKRTMLEARLRRRLRSLSLDSYSRYCEYLFTPEGRREEIVSFLDVVTTNKTDFFREPGHFTFLAGQALPEMAARAEAKPLLVWSAGCSSGEEPYTLAMVLSEYAEAHPGFRFRILATDISTQVLEKAQLGIYTSEEVEPVPPVLRRKYLMRSRERGSDQVRVVPELRQLVEFRRLNFMDADYGVAEKADAIFCRNVIIYFDRATQEEILRKLTRHLVPQGYLFVGHSETLHDMDLPLTAIGPALYRRSHGHG